MEIQACHHLPILNCRLRYRICTGIHEVCAGINAQCRNYSQLGECWKMIYAAISQLWVALVWHYFDTTATSMRQVCNKNKMTRTVQLWRKMSKEIIILLYWEYFMMTSFFWVLNTRRRPVNLVSLSSHVLVLLVHRDSSLKQHQLFVMTVTGWIRGTAVSADPAGLMIP